MTINPSLKILDSYKLLPHFLPDFNPIENLWSKVKKILEPGSMHRQ